MKRHPMRTDLTAEYVRSLFTYHPDTGFFIRCSPRARVVVGTRAGYQRKDGYREIMIDGVAYLEHRLAWLVTYGVWPVLDVDHIDGTKSHNALANLREASRSNNCKNANRRGYCEERGKFVAYISIDFRRRIIGYFETEEQAKAARLNAIHNNYGEFSITRRPSVSGSAT